MSALSQEALGWAHGVFQRIEEQLSKVIVGQKELTDGLLLALATHQHLLLEGVPGLAKTLSVKTLSQALSLDFRRIQFTPDLLPSDLLGTLIFHPGRGDFSVKKGPLFAQIVLADEVNRAPAKVQSALLEAMEERQITLGDESHSLPRPFLVLATQNPMEQEGTYPLPEAQLDRFMLKVRIGYPGRDEELAILASKRASKVASNPPEAVASAADLEKLSSLVSLVHIEPAVEGYIVDLVRATRDPAFYGLPLQGLIRWGASPRAALFLSLASRARALLSGRDFVLPEDVQALAYPVLRHRILLTYEAAAEDKTSDDLIAVLLKGIVSP